MDNQFNGNQLNEAKVQSILDAHQLDEAKVQSILDAHTPAPGHDEIMERRRLAIIDKVKAYVKDNGASSARKLYAIAAAAMANDPKASQFCKDLTGEKASPFSTYTIEGAALELMTNGEQDMSINQAIQDSASVVGLARRSDEYLANNLQSVRKSKGLTQKELASRCHMPIVTLQKLENGSNTILRARVETVMVLAAALGVSMEELCTAPKDA